MITAIKRAVLALLAAMVIMAVAATPAMAAGPDPYVVVVHITDGSSVTPADQAPDPRSERISFGADWDFVRLDDILFIEVGSEGVSVSGFEQDPDGNSFAWGTVSDEAQDDQHELGNTAVGLKAADQACTNYGCHVILVNYQQPDSREHRIAAKAAAEALEANGRQLHSVAVGPANARHLGFNWYLSGQAFNASPDEAVDLVDTVTGHAKVSEWIAVFVQEFEYTIAPDWAADKWNNLSYIEKIWLNPLDCDLETQWLWAWDATCHDK